MNKYTEQAVKEWERIAHQSTVKNQRKAFQLAVQMRNFNACSVLRLAIVVNQLKSIEGIKMLAALYFVLIVLFGVLVVCAGLGMYALTLIIKLLWKDMERSEKT